MPKVLNIYPLLSRFEELGPTKTWLNLTKSRLDNKKVCILLGKNAVHCHRLGAVVIFGIAKATTHVFLALIWFTVSPLSLFSFLEPIQILNY